MQISKWFIFKSKLSRWWKIRRTTTFLGHPSLYDFWIDLYSDRITRNYRYIYTFRYPSSEEEFEGEKEILYWTLYNTSGMWSWYLVRHEECKELEIAGLIEHTLELLHQEVSFDLPSDAMLFKLRWSDRIVLERNGNDNN